MLIKKHTLLRLCVGEVIYRLLEAHIASVLGYLKTLLLLLRNRTSRLYSRLCSLELLLGFFTCLLCFQLSSLRRFLGGRLISYGLRLRSLDNCTCLTPSRREFSPQTRAEQATCPNVQVGEVCAQVVQQILHLLDKSLEVVVHTQGVCKAGKGVFETAKRTLEVVGAGVPRELCQLIGELTHNLGAI